jgi:hypothetical protein
MWKGKHLALAFALVWLVPACEGENRFVGTGFDGTPFAAPGMIEGSVTVSGTPVGAAWVVAIELQDSTVTNSQGRFRFFDVPAAIHTISLRVPLHYRLVPGDSTTQTVTVTPGGLGVANWRLVPAGPIQ